MANVIRYKRDQPTKRGLKKGNTVVGIGDENYGPTSTTGYVAGIVPPDGGYTVYTLSGNNDPAIYVANNDNDLIAIARTLGGGNLTALESKNYLRRKFNTWVLDSIPNNFITDGLIVNLDAGNESSFIDNQPTTNYVPGTFPYAYYAYVYFNGGVEVVNERNQFITAQRYTITNTVNTARAAIFPTGLTTGVAYTFSFKWKYNGTTTTSPSIEVSAYKGNPEGGSNNNSFTSQTADTVNIGQGWYLTTYTFLFSSNPTGACMLTFGIGTGSNTGYLNETFDVYEAQFEISDSGTPFADGTREQNPIWKNISGRKKPLNELRVLGAHHSGYQYPPFYNYFRVNCNMTNEPVVNDLPNNWPASQVAEEFDLVIVDEYVWAMGGSVIDWMKECVDLGVSCIGVGNDQRTGTFVASYNTSTRQSHDVRIDSKSPFGLQGRIFTYGSGDVYGGITALQNGAIPVYYRDDVDRIMGYVYENDETGAAFWFDQEGLQSTSTELFEAGLDYITRNIGNRGFLYNSPTYNSNGWFDFDGVDDFIELKNLPTFDMYCFEVVFRPHKTISPNTGPASSDYSLVGFGRDIGNNNGVNLYEWTSGMTNETVTFWSHDGFATGITDTVDTNWHHMFFNWNGTTYDIWLDGEQKSTIQRSTGHAKLQTNVSAISPGKNIGYNYYHSGSIAKIRAYDRALLDSEISQNYYGGPIVTDGLTFATDAGNLVSYENGSTTVYSLTGSDSGTLINGASFNSSNGGVFTFDGANEYISIPAASALGTSQITVAAWVYPTQDATTGGRTRGAVFGGPGALYLGLWPNGSAGSSAIHTAVQTTSGRPSTQTGTIYTNQWSYLLATYDGANFKTYLNGEYVTQTSQTGTISAGSTYYIGTYSALTDGNHNFPGKIACATIYNRSLSEDEILQNYNAQKARFGK